MSTSFHSGCIRGLRLRLLASVKLCIQLDTERWNCQLKVFVADRYLHHVIQGSSRFHNTERISVSQILTDCFVDLGVRPGPQHFIFFVFCCCVAAHQKGLKTCKNQCILPHWQKMLEERKTYNYLFSLASHFCSWKSKFQTVDHCWRDGDVASKHLWHIRLIHIHGLVSDLNSLGRERDVSLIVTGPDFHICLGVSENSLPMALLTMLGLHFVSLLLVFFCFALLFFSACCKRGIIMNS